MRCPRCYAYVEEGAYSCDTCGADLSNREALLDDGAAARPGQTAARPRRRSGDRPTPRHTETKSSNGGFIIVIVLLIAALIGLAVYAFGPFGHNKSDATATQNQTLNTNVAVTDSQVKIPAALTIPKANSSEFPKMTVYLTAASVGKQLDTLDDKQLSVSESAASSTYECEIESVKKLEAADVEKAEVTAPKYTAVYEIVYKTSFTNKEAARTVLVSCAPDCDYTATASLVYNPSQAAKTEEEKKAESSAQNANATNNGGNANQQQSNPEPAPAPAPTPAPQPSGDSSYVLPDSSSRVYSTAELSGLSSADLANARNEIYARHGYIFQRTEILNYFKGKTWYNPTVPASSFSWDTLNSAEKQNALNIKEVEASRG